MPSLSDPSPAVLRVHAAGAVAVLGADEAVVADCVVLALGVAVVGDEDVAGWLDALVELPGAEQPSSSMAAMTATRAERPSMG
jgi:hypothetical protein